MLIFLSSTTFLFGQNTPKILSGLTDYIETISDKNSFPDQYHFDYAYKVTHNHSNDSIENFIIYSAEKGNYFALSKDLSDTELMVFDLSKNYLITFCSIDNNQYAISGPLSFFDQFKVDQKVYNFTKNLEKGKDKKKIKHISYTSSYKGVITEIDITNEKKFKNNGFKKGFWMIIQESNSTPTPLIEKGSILEIRTKTSKNQSKASINEVIKLDKNIILSNYKLIDFGALEQVKKDSL
ncbi:hypothetical protein EO216_02765 [Flammeovirga kamogawensis]|uniref:GLPGLI family protein n=1 Tax=Flammeovirga kamogawensis TaxID=373891 RepID=A0ABX8GYX6_9BACT|nr:hypothetical protein [Flammeovirga kamogawensis]QWG08818.1 hypothetical protein KM029_07720 [Flammeovirga kamogawensis]TRX67108.1 hypothetical protein EO216_02765 [Flammeovirga kamogawensis]